MHVHLLAIRLGSHILIKTFNHDTIPVVSARPPREKRNFILRPRIKPRDVSKANYRRSPIPPDPDEYIRVHRIISVESSRGEYAHHHLGCQKTRWHLKERSRGQEVSLALPRRPYQEMILLPSSLPPAPTTYGLLPAPPRVIRRALFLPSLLRQPRDHPSAGASASLRLPSPSAL